MQEFSSISICLSLVVPCNNEEETIPLFYQEIVKVLSPIEAEKPFEIIFIDDGSRDKTLDLMRNLSINDDRVHYVSFSRNFGKEAAILAGLNAARGEYVVLLDADGQDPPSLIPEMLDAVYSGEADCAGTRRVTRKGEPLSRSFFARCFYSILKRLADVEVTDGARDFRLMNRKYLEAVLALGERSRFSKGIYPWVGFNVKWFEFPNIERRAGKTNWSFGKLLLYSLDGITAFSSKPLVIASYLGFILFLISMISLAFVVIRRLVWGDPVDGWASTVSIIIFCSGVQLFSIGILGQYVARIYSEVKQRPHYIIKEAR